MSVLPFRPGGSHYNECCDIATVTFGGGVHTLMDAGVFKRYCCIQGGAYCKCTNVSLKDLVSLADDS